MEGVHEIEGAHKDLHRRESLLTKNDIRQIAFWLKHFVFNQFKFYLVLDEFFSLNWI